MLKDIAEAVNNQHRVTVLTTSSSIENETVDRETWSKSNGIAYKTLKIDIEKKLSITRKLINSLIWATWTLYQLITNKPDIVIVATTPPIITAMIVRWASRLRGFRYIYHCQDIHPEAMRLNGNLRKGFLYQTLIKIDTATMKKAWKIVTLSSDMKQTIAQRGCATSNVEVINNFIFDQTQSADSTTKVGADRKITFLFAGSLGRLQNLEILMKALVILKEKNSIKFVFMGDGVVRNNMMRIKENHNLQNVVFLGQRSTREAVTAMQKADMGIISISEGICDVAYPSKTMMYLGNGLPVFALIDENTELFNFIKNENLGYASCSRTPEEIARSIMKASELLKEDAFDRTRIKTIANEYFGKDIILKRFEKLLCDD